MKAYVIFSKTKFDALMGLLPPEQTDPKTGEVIFSPTLKDVPQIGSDLERVFGPMLAWEGQRHSKDGKTAIFEVDIDPVDTALLERWKSDGIISDWRHWQHDENLCTAATPAAGYPCIQCYFTKNAKQYL